VPPPGQVARLTQSNGLLANKFNLRAASYFNIPFYFAKIVNDYSGSFVNPWFGEHGALIFFGGGHAATNDNSVVGLVLGDTCRFTRLVDPSPISGRGTDTATLEANIFQNGTAFSNDGWADTKVDQRPVSPHSYGSGDVIGPADGGAVHGSFIRVISGAGGFGGEVAAEAAHQVPFATLTGAADGPTPSYAWQRLANKPGAAFNKAASSNIGPPQWSAFVPAQRRVYYVSRNNRGQRWFDTTTRSYVDGTGAGLTANADGPDTGILFHVPTRNLLVFMDRFGGRLRARVCDVSVNQPAWDNNAVTLSTALPLALEWACACWCEDNNRIVLADVAGDSNAAYEITIPQRLGDPWPVERAPFPAGQTIRFNKESTYKKWSYNPRVRSIVYMPYASPDAEDDVVYVYRPRGT
jgi:hypothetical protein